MCYVTCEIPVPGKFVPSFEWLGPEPPLQHSILLEYRRCVDLVTGGRVIVHGGYHNCTAQLICKPFDSLQSPVDRV